MNQAHYSSNAASFEAHAEIKVSAVMPCLNEEETLEVCITKAQKCFERLGVVGEVVIADNGSTDNSVKLAESLGARVVYQEVKGYGAAIRKGIEAARGEYVIIGDSDDSYDWSNLGPFIDKLEEGNDLVIGNRFKGGISKGAMPPLHRFLGNPVLSLIAKVFFRSKIGDFHCGLRGLRKAVFPCMHLTTTGMEFATEMIANASLQGLKIAEVPTTLSPDGRNRPPHLRSFRDGWRHLRFIFTYAPDYLYVFPSIVLGVLGLSLMLVLVRGPIVINGFYMGIHFLALGCLLFSLGGIVFGFGVGAKIILRMKFEYYNSLICRLLDRWFSVNKAILICSILIIGGSFYDFLLFFRWLLGGQPPMENSVHLVFVSTTLVAIGVAGALGAFLIGLMMEMRREKDLNE